MQTTHTPVTSLKEKQRKERERLILQAAEDVFQEKGYYDASMDEVAARVGIAKGTIYTHFPGKEELVIAIFERDMRKFLEGVDSVLDAQPTPVAKLEALLQFIFVGLDSKLTRLLSSMYNGVDMKRMIVQKGGCVHELWAYLVTRTTQLIEEGKAMGEFDATIPTKIMLFSFLSLCSPKTYEHLLLGEDMSHEEMVKNLWRVYSNGITKHDEK